VGFLQPLVVRPGKGPTANWVIIAGHRRFLAAKRLKLDTVPAIIRSAREEADALTLALIENLQREDLTPLEEARSYQELGLSHSQIAHRVHKGTPTIGNALRLLNLPADVQDLIEDGTLTPAHGRALARYADVAPPEQAAALVEALAQHAIATGATSKQVEAATFHADRSLLRQGTTRVLSGPEGPLFDASICQACPFNASRQGFCLNPPHFDALQAEARDRRAAERDVALAAAQEEAAERGEAVPHLIHLDPATYIRLYDSLPAGCTADCACRRQAIDYRAQLVPICTDPEQHQRLASAAAVRDRERATAAATRDAERIGALLRSDRGDPTQRELVALAYAVLGTLNDLPETEQALAIACGAHGVPPAFLQARPLQYPRRSQILRLLPSYREWESREMIPFLLHTICLAEIARERTGYHNPPLLTRYLLGEIEDDSSPAT